MCNYKKSKMGSCIDLRKYEDENSISDAFGALVSGKKGYKTVIERKKPTPKCEKCGRGGDPEQKFCPQCGGKMVIPMTHCPKCKKLIDDIQKFCMECGGKIRD